MRPMKYEKYEYFWLKKKQQKTPDLQLCRCAGWYKFALFAHFLMAFMFSGLVYEGKGDMSECSQYMKKAIGLSQYVYFLILPFFFSSKNIR